MYSNVFFNQVLKFIVYFAFFTCYYNKAEKRPTDNVAANRNTRL